MRLRGKRLRARVLRRWPAALLALAALLGGDGTGRPAVAGPANAPAGPQASDPLTLLREVRPDYHLYIAGVRPLPPDGHARVYMALVRPGASDPLLRDSAPFAGPGARNDVVYDRARLGGERTAAWSLLLLDHEYFHARHLAGATSLPLAGTVAPRVERHFYEAAAWGFNVSEARAGRYPGLRPEEFREALDRYGEHYAALKALLRADETAWGSISGLLRRPAVLLKAFAGWRPQAPARLSGPDRARAIP